MKTFTASAALAFSFCTLMMGCADVSDVAPMSLEEQDADDDPLAQVTGIDWPGRTSPTTPRRPTSSGDSAGTTNKPTQTTSTQPTQPPATNGDTQILTVPNPNGTYFADVTAVGPGCKPGTWTARVSSDGLAFTILFSAYELKVNSQETMSAKTSNCAINLKMHSPAGRTYAVSYFSYTGYAFLEPGVRATLSTNYQFPALVTTSNGTTTPIGNRSEVLVGEKDLDFAYEHKVETTDLVYSDCGTNRDLQIKTSLILQNSSPKRSGYVNLSAVDGRTSSVTVRVLTKPCTVR